MAWHKTFSQPSTDPEINAKNQFFHRLRPRWGRLAAWGMTQAIAPFIIQGIVQGTVQIMVQGMGGPAAQAAEQIVLHYSGMEMAIPLDELEAALAPTASAPHRFRFQERNVPLLQLHPELSSQLRQLLTQPFPSPPPEQVDHLFRSPSGEALLDAVAEVILVDHASPLPRHASDLNPGQKLAGPGSGGGTEKTRTRTRTATRTATRTDNIAALRTALVGAAASPEGVTGLNVLRHFPGDIHWNVRRTLLLWQQRKQLQQKTQAFLTMLDQLEESGQKANFRPAGSVEDLRLPGPIAYQSAELNLWDPTRDRPLPVQLYLPDFPDLPGLPDLPEAATSSVPNVRSLAKPTAGDRPKPVPLVIMSHGLGANRHSRQFLAQHLASHGFAVAMVQHPGSDSEQFQALLRGKAAAMVTAQDFIDRPQDIRFVLDELGRITRGHGTGASKPMLKASPDEPQGRKWQPSDLRGYPLDLDRVSLFGHSFGAYTALAIAGAEINFPQLHKDCQAESMLLDLSLVLQCQALELEAQPLPQFKDDRIAALILADPVSRSIFGEQELAKVKVPVLWMGGARDNLTPFSLSQVPSFGWLGSREKHLAVAEATNHLYLTSELREPPGDQQGGQPAGGQLGSQTVGSPRLSLAGLEETAYPLAVQNYTNALGLAFVQAHLGQKPRYRGYLEASYAQQLSQAPHHLRLWWPRATPDIAAVFED